MIKSVRASTDLPENVSQLHVLLCSGIAMILWMHGCTQPIPVSKVGMPILLTNQAMGSPQYISAELQFTQSLPDTHFIMAG